MAATQNHRTSTASDKKALTQVNHLATKFNLPVDFADCQEPGPVHHNIYPTTIKVGPLSAVGEAHSKKQARVCAAANILDHLKEMCRKLDLKPNGHLFEVAQANGWGFPRYVLLDSRQVPWGWLFTMKVSVHGVEAVATGPTCQAAKQNAAAKMLEVLGFECPSYNPLLHKKDNVSTTPQANLLNKEQVEKEDQRKNTNFFNSQSCLDQTRQDLCSSPDVIIEEIVEYLDEASVPCETDPVLDSISLCEILLEIQTGSEEQGLCETPDKETDPETVTNPTPEIVGPEMCSEPEDETEDVSGTAIPDEGPVSDSGDPSQVPRETELFPIQEDVTPGSDHNHTPELSEMSVDEEFPPSPNDRNVPEDYTGPDRSVQCEADSALDSISLSEILVEINTEMISEGSPVEVSFPDGPPEEHTEVLESMTTPGSDQNHTSEQDQGMSESNISSQKEPTSSQILEGPPVACFIIRALVRKLVKNSIYKPEDQAEVVRLLLKKTKDKILNQDIPISVKNMRAVGKAAAKDLLKEIELQGGQMSAEDEAFQEAMVKHINNHLRNFLFGPKKKRLSRLFAAVGRFFCAQ